jgi:membrane-bound metal-dependent hydrolase YbcI (DUF457 family)
MLPDFLDFRFARFLEQRDADIAPGHAPADLRMAQALADAIAHEVHLARAGSRPRVMQLHPRRTGVIDWILYSVRFDAASAAVEVCLGEHVAQAHTGPLFYAYDGALELCELGGPSLQLAADADGLVRIAFLPWHRTWSHSLVLALALGLLVAWQLGPLLGWAAGLGYAVHVLEDQLGYLGSNLFWPLTRTRSEGLRLLHSGDAIPNFITVWLSLALLLFQLDRAQPVPLLAELPYLLFAVVLPSLLLGARYGLRRTRRSIATLREREAEAEGGER